MKLIIKAPKINGVVQLGSIEYIPNKPLVFTGIGSMWYKETSQNSAAPKNPLKFFEWASDKFCNSYLSVNLVNDKEENEVDAVSKEFSSFLANGDTIADAMVSELKQYITSIQKEELEKGEVKMDSSSLTNILNHF